MPPLTSIPSPLKWDLKAAAREFGWTAETLRRKLTQAKQIPSAAGTWTTAQIVSALFGNIATERLRKTAAEADHWELRNDVLRGEHLPKALLTPALEQIFVVISQLIMASSMTSQEKKALLETIATWPIAVRTVAVKAAKQGKLERGEGKNGHEDSEAD